MIFLSEAITAVDFRLSIQVAKPRARLTTRGLEAEAEAEIDVPVVDVAGVQAWLAEAGLTVTQILEKNGRVQLRAARAN